ncbi:28S ribosomal protein S18a, mitochondrial [Condylostylus longicornis]|uniref:28S ribosomal protein S18a, mitochondrial n=1 Tax=Condylostylus longicornis TaxID=2530218 RepID=UPI00244DBC15|nr:28S ribosomal protein S18a, mitochondrial [Condylostylus longicornis]
MILPKFVITSLVRHNYAPIFRKHISTTTSCSIKEILENKEGEQLIVQGVYKDSPRARDLLDEAKKANFCPECTLGLEIKHTDVLILSQYVRNDGCMLPRRVTGLCKRQQRKIGSLVTMAQKAGLMPNLNPVNSHKNPKKRFGWKKYNKYYNEFTIKY